MSITNLNEWHELMRHKQDLDSENISMLLKEPDRFREFSVELDDILFDYSKQRLTKDTISNLINFAKARNLLEQKNKLLSGDFINVMENRKVGHTLLREATPIADIQAELDKVESFVAKIHNSTVDSVISIGIGGSHLGPELVCEALKHYKVKPDLNFYFLSNLDAATIQSTLDKLNPMTTICIINSKTFTTLETISIADIVKSWLKDANKLIATTTNIEKAVAYGIKPDNIFKFWDFVGGRYSIWSVIGLPIALAIGFPGFKSFLTGANIVDRHFALAPLEKNIPVIAALIGIWNINFLGADTLAIIPYLDRLKYLPDYLQQLDMESNGKSASNNSLVNYKTAPVIWGGVGCNSQHAYMQLLHQGPSIIPIDFIAVVNNQDINDTQAALVGNCLAQSKALLEGRSIIELRQNNKEELAIAKFCPGARPSSTFMLKELSPKTMGMLLAIYEHKVFVQGVLWDIRSFDQWGVELGKELAKGIIPYLTGQTDIIDAGFDSSTAGLIKYYKDNLVR